MYKITAIALVLAIVAPATSQAARTFGTERPFHTRNSMHKAKVHHAKGTRHTLPSLAWARALKATKSPGTVFVPSFSFSLNP